MVEPKPSSARKRSEFYSTSIEETVDSGGYEIRVRPQRASFLAALLVVPGFVVIIHRLVMSIREGATLRSVIAGAIFIGILALGFPLLLNALRKARLSVRDGKLALTRTPFSSWGHINVRVELIDRVSVLYTKWRGGFVVHRVDL
jgi:hypothetical protein